jgi:hypothetical protein
VNLKLSGYILQDYQAWGHLIQRCSYGSIENITIDVFSMVYNQDGIDIGHGTKHFSIRNVSGASYDDTVALVDWALGTFLNPAYAMGGTEDILFENFNVYQLGSGNTFRFLAGDGGSIKNIRINSIKCFYADQALFKFGEDNYPTVKPSKDDITSIIIDGVEIDEFRSTLEKTAAVSILSSCSDVHVTNLVNNSGKPDSYIDRTGRTIENFTINGVEV